MSVSAFFSSILQVDAPERPDWHESSAGLLHEVLQNAGRPDGFQPDQALRPPWDRPAPATRLPRPWERLPFPEACGAHKLVRDQSTTLSCGRSRDLPGQLDRDKVPRRPA